MNKDYLNHLFSTRRFVYFVSEDLFVEGQGYRACIVFENEPGLCPTGDWPYEGKVDQKAPYFWGPTYEDACRISSAMNARMGIDDEDAIRIVSSSMRS